MEKDKTLRLTTPGVSLALCFSEQLVSGGDVYGLLFGAVTHDVTTAVTDSGSKEVTKICIDVQIYCPLKFFGLYGEIHEDVFQKAVQQHPQKLLGWFAFRANTPLRVSVKEHSVHGQLEKVAAASDAENNHSPPLLFAMLTNSTTTNFSTQSFDYRFVSRESVKLPFTSMELNITNPEHKSQAEYGEFSAFSTFSEETPDKGINSFTHVPSAPLQTLHSFAASQQERVYNLIEELELGDVEEIKLVAEVEALRKEHAALQASAAAAR